MAHAKKAAASRLADGLQAPCVLTLGRKRGRGLAYYRLYLQDREGRISDFKAWEGEDDAAALAWAARHSHRHGMELWNLDRLVRRIAPARDGEADGGSAP